MEEETIETACGMHALYDAHRDSDSTRQNKTEKENTGRSQELLK